MKKEIYIFVIACTYRLIIFLALLWWSGQAGFMYPLQGSDANGYWLLAENIRAEGELYIEDERFLKLRRPPGYPTFLAVVRYALGNTTSALYTISLLQILLTAYAAVLFYRLIIRFASEKVAWLASLFFALEPNSAYYSTFILSDALFVFLFIAAVYIFITNQTIKSFFVAGFLLGLAMLVRPIAQFFPPLAVLYILYAHGFNRRSFVHIAAFLLGAMLLTIPWMAHNARIASSFDLSSSGANTYYRYIMPQFVSWHTGKEFNKARETILSNFDNAIAQGDNSAAFMQRELIRYVSDAPLSYVIFHTVKTAPFFLGDGIREILQRTYLLTEKQPNISSELLHGNALSVFRLVTQTPHLLIAVAGGLFWSFVLLLALFGFWRGIHNKNQRPFVLFFASIILYLAALTGPATSTRHRMPALPFIAGLAAIGFCELSGKQKRDHTKDISSPEFLKAVNPPQT